MVAERALSEKVVERRYPAFLPCTQLLSLLRIRTGNGGGCDL